MKTPQTFIPDAVIFDLDGTLWDTATLCADAWNEALKLRNKDYRKITSTDISSVMGLTAQELRRKIFHDLSDSEGNALLKECFVQETVNLRRIGGRLYPGVTEGLQSLSHRYALHLVSNCDSPYLEAFFETTGLREHFTDWECHGNTGLSKGENLKSVLERNQIQSAVYVGDTEGDLKAARFAGLPFIHMSYGFGQVKDADLSFADFAQLSELLLKN